MEQNWQRGLSACLVLNRVAKLVGLRHPLRSRQGYLAFVFSFRDQHAVEADVVHNHAVREVFDGEGDEIIVTVALNLQHHGGRLRRCHGDFQRLAGLVGHRSRGLRLRSRSEVNEQLRFGPKCDFAEVVPFFGYNVADDHRRGDDF